MFAGVPNGPYIPGVFIARNARMKIPALMVALIAAVALAAPAEAASKKKSKKVSHRAPVSAVHSHDVYVGGEYVGRDPDPNIRSFMIRNPRIYDGPL